jgi:hypothetical protein
LSLSWLSFLRSFYPLPVALVTFWRSKVFGFRNHVDAPTTSEFWNIDVGNLLTLLGAVVAIWKARYDVQKDTRERHEENRRVLHAIKVQQATNGTKLEHLQERADENRQAIAEIREELMAHIAAHSNPQRQR